MRCISFNAHLCGTTTANGEILQFMTSHHPEAIQTDGSIDIYPTGTASDCAMVEVDSFECVPIARTAAQDDKEVFGKIIWDLANPAVDSMPPVTFTTNS